MTTKEKLNILIVGGGGREHALAWKVASSPLVNKLYCAPGNGGTALMENCENVPIAVDQFDKLAEFAKDAKVDLTVIGPDNPLADGIVDALEGHGLKVFGPKKEAALLEASKSHAKYLMTQWGVPTARYATFTDKNRSLEFCRENEWARVIKVDGLAFGKGVFVCDSLKEVEEALATIFDDNTFGESGKKILVEEKLDGEELSLFLLIDGKTAVTLAACQDHKRRFDGDKGPNTGGMGAYSPVPLYESSKEDIERLVVNPIQTTLARGELDFKGVLFIGLMMKDRVPQVLEFNVRFGDPEAQVILPRMTSDLVPLLMGVADGKLKEAARDMKFAPDYAMCVVAAAENYPQSSSKGARISIPDQQEGTVVFHAGTSLEGGELVTNGGRVLSVVGCAKDANEAREKAYEAISKISFTGISYRTDIAWRLIAQCQSK